MIAITLARKPLLKGSSVARNALAYGTGGMNIDASRIAGPAWTWGTQTDIRGGGFNSKRPSEGDVFATNVESNPMGRWPSNLILRHLEGCRQDGAKKIRGSNNPGRSSHGSGERGIGYGGGDTKAAGFPYYTDPENYGVETVESWVCQPGCPVAELDRQSESASRFFLQVQHEDAQLNMSRASGDCICAACGQDYLHHPTDGRAPFLNVLCDGSRKKL